MTEDSTIISQVAEIIAKYGSNSEVYGTYESDAALLNALINLNSQDVLTGLALVYNELVDEQKEGMGPNKRETDLPMLKHTRETIAILFIQSGKFAQAETYSNTWFAEYIRFVETYLVDSLKDLDDRVIES